MNLPKDSTQRRLFGQIMFALGFIVFFILALRPFFEAGWYDDDLSNSLYRYAVEAYKIDWPGRLNAFFVTGGQVPGRFFPFAGYAFLLFYLTPTLLCYRLVILGFVLSNLVLLIYLVKRFTGRLGCGVLCALLVPAAFQYREFYDPILSFHAMMPLILFLTLGSLTLLDVFLERRKFVWLWASALLYAVSLLTYEITYAFFILHLALLWIRLRNVKRVLSYFVCFAIPLGFVVVMSMRARHQAAEHLVGTYKVHFALKAYVLTWLKQGFGAFPLSYFLSDPHRIFVGFWRSFFARIEIVDLVAVGLFSTLYFKIPKQPVSAASPWNLVALGAGFWGLPGTLLALSPHYQRLLEFGVPHLPVYLEYFGIVLLGAGLYQISAIKDWPRWRGFTAGKSLTVIFGLIYLVNFQTNRLVVERRNLRSWYPRNVMEVVASNGVFSSLPEGAQLLIEADDQLSLDYPMFIYSLAKRNLFALNTKKVVAWEKSQPNASKEMVPEVATKKFLKRGPTYIAKYWADSKTNGNVVMAQLRDLKLDPLGQKTGVQTSVIDVYVLGGGGAKIELSYRYFARSDGGKAAEGAAVNLPLDYQTLQGRANGVSHYRVTISLPEKSWLDFRSANVVYASR